MEVSHDGNHLFPLSPTTRRRARGRGGVLDNMTASTITNQVVPSPRFEPEGILTPSPDELIIQARGRRSIPLIFSPESHWSPLRGKRVSALSPRPSGRHLLLLPTRTSPRKRLTLSDVPPAPSQGPHHPHHPLHLANVNKQRSPISKKFRLEPIESLSTSLKALSPDQMTTLFSRLLEKRPEIAPDVRVLMPQPDLSPLEERLSYLKRNVYKALPNTRLESKTDSLAYNRVATHLLAFKKALLEQGKTLGEAHTWPVLLDYSLMAWAYVKATPVWDNPPHNNIRKQCFKALSGNCMMALKKGQWKKEVLSDIKNKMMPLKQDSEEIMSCLKYIDQVFNN